MSYARRADAYFVNSPRAVRQAKVWLSTRAGSSHAANSDAVSSSFCDAPVPLRTNRAGKDAHNSAWVYLIKDAVIG